MKSFKFNPGDVVVLKSNPDVKMVIAYPQSNFVYRCKWLDHDLKVVEADFAFSMLRKVSNPLIKDDENEQIT